MSVFDEWDPTFSPFTEDIHRRDIKILKPLFKELLPVIDQRADAIATALKQPDWRSSDPREVLDAMAERIQAAEPQRVLIPNDDMSYGYALAPYSELTPSWGGLSVDLALIVGEMIRAVWRDRPSQWSLFAKSYRFGHYGTPVVGVEPISISEYGWELKKWEVEVVFGVTHQIRRCAASGGLPNLVGQLGGETNFLLWGHDPTGFFGTKTRK